MTESYRATLIVVGVSLAMCLASWRLLQLETGPVTVSASPAPLTGGNAAHPSSTEETRPAPQPSAPPQDRVADLISAAQRGDVNAVLALVKKGVSINSTGQDHLTPLLAAITKGSVTPAQIEKLLRAGADATARDSTGRDALTLAAEKDDLDTVIALLKGSSNVVSHAAGALNGAASQNHIEALKAMLDNGVNVNAAGKDGQTALVSAIRHGDADTVRFLLSRDADSNRKDASGVTPLMLAIARGDRDVVQAVAEKATASINDRNSKGETALLQAVRGKNPDLAKTLIDAGSDVNAADFEQTTPLIAAAADGRGDVVQALLDKGADVHTKDGQGETALSLARKREHPEIADLLIKAGAPDDAPQ